MEEKGSTIENSWVRRWEDLNTDCLIKIFEKLGLESLILDIPFVCKSWYKASLDPLVYKVLRFEFMNVEEKTMWATTKIPDDLLAENMYSKAPPSTEFIKVAVNRSCGMATEVVFPEYSARLADPMEEFFSVSALEYLLERCSAIKTLIVPYFSFFYLGREINQCLLKMISKLKHLEFLGTLTCVYSSPHVINEIRIHCQNFQSLTAKGFISMAISSEIVTSLPDIKRLVLRDCSLHHQDLIDILSGCSKLELLDASNCRNFNGDDPMILKLASHINIFKSEGSVVNNVVYDDDDDDDDNFYVSLGVDNSNHVDFCDDSDDRGKWDSDLHFL
ncbi:F-box/LRR-repeat protein [Thalictrum thalictroides]|uniref:F-box/LRR-repeat protein n=1 Tax=Thalictrum thalictroides TaxID=46969 RepID=A0A7J6X8B3_THATH|nr:F-box/LRR-repeat protein [Thalictrum thalictroides]